MAEVITSEISHNLLVPELQVDFYIHGHTKHTINVDDNNLIILIYTVNSPIVDPRVCKVVGYGLHHPWGYIPHTHVS